MMKGDCFQILGFDVFIDQNLKPWLLEINENPSMNIEMCKEGTSQAHPCLLKSPSEVDKHIKVKCLGDALNLMLSTRCAKSRESSTQKRNATNKFGCWQRLEVDKFKSQDNSINLASQLFMKLQGTHGLKTG